MSLLRKHLVIRAHMEFRALFATKNSQFLPRKCVCLQSDTWEVHKEERRLKFCSFCRPWKVDCKLSKGGNMFINFVIQNLPDQELYPASQRKSQDCWSLNDASIEIYSQVSKVEALAEKWQKHQGPGTCSGAVSWLLWLPPPGNQWRSHPGSQTLRHPETPGSHHLLVLLPELQTTHELLFCWLFKLSYSKKAAWSSVIKREKKKEKNLSTPGSSAFPPCLHLTLLKHTQDYSEPEWTTVHYFTINVLLIVAMSSFNTRQILII